MADFTHAVDIVIAHEGACVDNPNDPGGMTKYGISQRAFPAVNIAELTEGEARALYRINYWNPLYDQIKYQPLADKLLDFGVNGGTAESVRLLQAALGFALPDGVFGTITLTAANARNGPDLLNEFKARIAVRYAEICIERPASREFLLGWMRRAVA